MENRLKVVNSFDINYWQECPVKLLKGNILIDSLTGKAILQLKAQNIGSKTVIAVFLRCRQYDVSGELLDDDFKIKYQDISVRSGGTFGEKTPIILSQDETRVVDINIEKIVCQDGEVIDPNPDKVYFDVQENASTLFNQEEIKQIAIEINSIRNNYFIPENIKAGWKCVCGQLNHESSIVCCGCKNGKQFVFRVIDKEYIASKVEARIKEQELRDREAELLREKRLKEEEERATASKKKRKKIALISGVSVVFICIVLLIISLVGKEKM